MVVRRHLLISVVKLMSLPSSIGATFIDLGVILAKESFCADSGSGVKVLPTQ